MLCTDGLSGMVDDVILAEILQADELQPVCDRLIREALDQGGRDNITVVLCDLRKMEASDHTPCKA